MLKKLALVLIAAIFVFSALAYQRNAENQSLADQAALLGKRPGGIVIHASSPAAAGAGGAAEAPKAATAPTLALPPAAAGSGCP